ncbi:hypothetical protein [Fischerella muscicola]|nr:hypothetical protein [Fischerella muscicola]
MRTLGQNLPNAAKPWRDPSSKLNLSRGGNAIKAGFIAKKPILFSINPL